MQKAAPGGDGDGGVTSKAALKTHPQGPNHTAAVRGELCFPHCRLPPCPGGLCQAGGGGRQGGAAVGLPAVCALPAAPHRPPRRVPVRFPGVTAGDSGCWWGPAGWHRAAAR